MPARLTLKREGHLVWLTAAQPASVGDAEGMSWELAEACQELAESEQRPALVVLSSPRSFFVETANSPEDLDLVAEHWSRATDAVASLVCATVAVIEGEAIGPALELALACDLRFAAPGSRFGLTQVKHGRLPSAGGSQRLGRAVGLPAATRLVLLSDVVSAEEAYQLQLVHRVQDVSPERVGLDLASISNASPLAVGYAKEAAHLALEVPLAAGMAIEADLAALLLTTVDRAEGMAAFAEKRKPTYVGE
jgi:enoyl-CoA hydratase